MTSSLQKTAGEAAARCRASQGAGAALFEWQPLEQTVWAEDATWRLLGRAAGAKTRPEGEFLAVLGANASKSLRALVARGGVGITNTLLTDNGPTGDALEADFQATGDSQGRVTHVSGVLRVRLGEGGPPLGGKNDTHCRRAIGSLSGSIAHELKNVLHVVRGYTSFAYQGVDPDTPLGDDLFQALAATDRAADIATRLLRFSRAEDDPNELLDLNEIVSDLSALVRPIFEPEIEMSVAIAAQPLPIIGMNATARMALLNLCVHLRESLGEGLGEGRRFVLRCDRMPNASDLVGSAGNPPSMGAYARILLAVEDHAGEAAIRNESALYERISQVEIESAKAALPLAIAQNIVNRVGGSLERLAKREGGTAYRVWLPLSKVALKRNSIGVAVPTTALPFSMAEEV